MTFEFFLFSIFWILTIVSSFMVISLSNAIHSVLFLILTFCNVAFLLLVLGAEFFSFLLLIVYVGAIAVLFLFVIMMLNIKIQQIKKQDLLLFSPIILIMVSYIGENLYNLCKKFDVLKFLETQIVWVSWLQEIKVNTTIEVIGQVLYTNYCLVFLLASLILLIAMIGVIVLTLHQKINLKKQKIELQLMKTSKKIIKFIELRSN